jgi:transposase
MEDYKGYLHTDCYGVYAAIDAANPAMTLVGCMAHTRCKFDQVVKGLSLIRKLYGIDTQLKGKSAEERYRLSRDKTSPIFDELRTWLDGALPDVAPQSATGKALHYLHNQWELLIRYLGDGRLAIDNNATERAIKPFVIGRKNWLFADAQRGATASANLYSLLETAKANGLEPYHHLHYLLTYLPASETLDQLEALLPWQVSGQQLAVERIPSPCSPKRRPRLETQAGPGVERHSISSLKRPCIAESF